MFACELVSTQVPCAQQPLGHVDALQFETSQMPLLQTWPAEHTLQTPPPEPQALLALPATHAPFSKQPLQVSAPHAPWLHTLVPVQAPH